MVEEKKKETGGEVISRNVEEQSKEEVGEGNEGKEEGEVIVDKEEKICQRQIKGKKTGEKKKMTKWRRRKRR